MILATPARHKTARGPRGDRILPIVAGQLRGGLAHFKLVAHFLDLQRLLVELRGEKHVEE
jgi:hypothetical protein